MKHSKFLKLFLLGMYNPFNATVDFNYEWDLTCFIALSYKFHNCLLNEAGGYIANPSTTQSMRDQQMPESRFPLQGSSRKIAKSFVHCRHVSWGISEISCFVRAKLAEFPRIEKVF